MKDKSKQNPKQPIKNFAGAALARNAGGLQVPTKIEVRRGGKTLPKAAK